MKASLSIFVAVFLAFNLPVSDIQAKTNDGHARFSISISGGASKGAYEAGLNWSMI